MDKELLVTIEKLRAEHEMNMASFHAKERRQLEEWKHDREWNLASTGWTIGFAKLALQGLLTISGGAVIALSAFIGNIWSDNCHFGDAKFFLYFIWSALLAVACSGISYIAQDFFSKNNNCSNNIGSVFRVLAIILFAVGLIAFGLGGYEAFDTITDGSMIVCPEKSKQTSP